MVCQDLALVEKVCEIYDKLSKLNSLKPSKDVNTLFTDLVVTCIPPAPIDVTKLCKKVQEMRSNLIKICGEAEGLLESHYSSILGSFDDNPLEHLSIFPYYSNYLKLSLLEFTILTEFCGEPKRVAFIGSGPLPLSSIVLATYHLTNTCFDNYDIDSSANSLASRLVLKDPDLSQRMFFHTVDVMDITSELKEYEVVFLAALVGMDKTDKVRVIDHLANYMAPGAILMLRSAHGARAFLYPVIDPCDLLGFELLSVFHPTDDVINSVVIARKLPTNAPHHHQPQLEPTIVLPSKCSENIESFIYPLNQITLIEELPLEDQLS